jgi:hypothetical protein
MVNDRWLEVSQSGIDLSELHHIDTSIMRCMRGMARRLDVDAQRLEAEDGTVEFDEIRTNEARAARDENSFAVAPRVQGRCFL